MIAMLMGWGLSSKVAKIVGYVAIPLLILAVIGGGIWFLRHDAYKDGKRDEAAAWQAASDKLIQKSLEAGTKAGEAAAVREADLAAKQEDEKEAIDAKLEKGESPFDALFGPAR